MSGFIWNTNKPTPAESAVATQTPEPTQEEKELLASNNWMRIGEDLWRNWDTTEELCTKDALILCGLKQELMEMVDSPEAEENLKALEEELTSILETAKVEEEKKPQFEFPD